MHLAHGSSSWLALFISLAACQGGGGEADNAEQSGGAGGQVENVGGEAGGAPPQSEGGAGGEARLDAMPAAKQDASAPAPDGSTKADAMVVGAGGANGSCKARICDDFEAHTVDQVPSAPWKPFRLGGTVVVDNQRAWSGKNSIHAFTSGGATQQRAYLSLQGAPVFDKPWPIMFGRMMLWVDHAVDAHWSHVEGEGRVVGKDFRAVTRYGGQFKRLIAQYDDVDGNFESDCAKRAPAVAMPEKKWVCYEWQFDSTKNAMRLWIDGQAIDAVSVNGRGETCLGNGTGGNWYLPQYEAIRMGWQNYQQVSGADVWIDDVAIGTERIGCPASR
ncbi:MAG: hypothetical protein SF187_30760 [Deltaproteobacteria bacterium]|nr:hypothetical protein [Deltaproteobacteria bacterium]